MTARYVYILRVSTNFPKPEPGRQKLPGLSIGDKPEFSLAMTQLKMEAIRRDVDMEWSWRENDSGSDDCIIVIDFNILTMGSLMFGVDIATIESRQCSDGKQVSVPYLLTSKILSNKDTYKSATECIDDIIETKRSLRFGRLPDLYINQLKFFKHFMRFMISVNKRYQIGESAAMVLTSASSDVAEAHIKNGHNPKGKYLW